MYLRHSGCTDEYPHIAHTCGIQLHMATRVITARVDEPTLTALDAVRTCNETRADVVRLAIDHLLTLVSTHLKEPRADLR